MSTELQVMKDYLARSKRRQERIDKAGDKVVRGLRQAARSERYNSRSTDTRVAGVANTPLTLVAEFHRYFGQARNIFLADRPLLSFRKRLLVEEYEEVCEKLNQGIQSPKKLDREGLAKELADLAYAVYGIADALGIDLDEAFVRVHESNMSKLGPDGKPILRADGKVLKGPGYFEPSMEDVVPVVIDVVHTEEV